MIKYIVKDRILRPILAVTILVLFLSKDIDWVEIALYFVFACLIVVGAGFLFKKYYLIEFYVKSDTLILEIQEDFNRKNINSLYIELSAIDSFQFSTKSGWPMYFDELSISYQDGEGFFNRIKLQVFDREQLIALICLLKEAIEKYSSNQLITSNK